ncbi:hypothetical protein FRX31_027364 [Thalictrum thalictroides]|uniref:Uncharacterized protein n=1 Tax=Thalictrum thalictroides TaxID=46969 RepID=A0A7J6VEJ9_THATH|nr:hypothetical protein FRX31_027364 [Thalictrum thalictroides]
MLVLVANLVNFCFEYQENLNKERKDLHSEDVCEEGMLSSSASASPLLVMQNSKEDEKLKHLNSQSVKRNEIDEWANPQFRHPDIFESSKENHFRIKLWGLQLFISAALFRYYLVPLDP